MKLLIRNLTVADGEETLLDNASYTFYQENVYCINAAKKYKNALFNSIAYVRQQEGGEIELICDGQDCIMPAMVARFCEEPSFPEFLTVREFVKYYIEINKKNITELKQTDEYLEMVELSDIRGDRLVRDFTWDERVRLQFLCFLITKPPVLIIDGIKNITNVEYLKKIKKYLDIIKQSGIVLLGCTDKSIAVFLGDEEITVVDGKLQGGI